MLTDEQAGDVVTKCIRAVSHVGMVDGTGSLDDAEIVDQTRVNNVVDLIVNNDQIGVPSKGQAIDASSLAGVSPDTIVADLINTVRDKSA